ncbi:hypothetical protein LCGC14_0727450 [marine sediment metagenome]|uniref:Uncharacterized protein n=1 Tax=marine sediment metagenome TaxID=412755 RepID=A0A0F9QAN2_9ZZZZ
MDQLDQLIEKYISYFKPFSLDNLSTHLPELLGHALFVGFYLGQDYYEISKWLDNLKRELERRKYENYIR